MVLLWFDLSRHRDTDQMLPQALAKQLPQANLIFKCGKFLALQPPTECLCSSWLGTGWRGLTQLISKSISHNCFNAIKAEIKRQTMSHKCNSYGNNNNTTHTYTRTGTHIHTYTGTHTSIIKYGGFTLIAKCIKAKRNSAFPSSVAITFPASSRTRKVNAN